MPERPWPLPELPTATAVWGAATAAVVAVAPPVVTLPLTVSAGPVVLGCAALGAALGRVAPARPTSAAAGMRVGAAVVVVGQLLDVVLVAANDGRYPRLDEGGTARLGMLLLGGYAAFLAGAARTDARRARPPIRRRGGAAGLRTEPSSHPRSAAHRGGRS